MKLLRMAADRLKLLKFNPVKVREYMVYIACPIHNRYVCMYTSIPRICIYSMHSLYQAHNELLLCLFVHIRR